MRGSDTFVNSVGPVDADTPAFIGRRYQVLNLIGRGGMGAVYRVIDRLSGRVITLKRVRVDVLATGASLARQQDARLSLAREFQVLADLKHPNIITVLDYGFDQGQPYFTMDLQEGAQSFVAGARAEPLSVQVDLLAQLLRAISYVHRRGILHRDLKPSNVLLVGGQVKVLDFGLSTHAASVTVGEVAEGTLAYMAPEVLRGKAPTRASDLYAVGVMAYEIFVGRHPYDLKDKETLVRQVVLSEPDLSPLDARPRVRFLVAALMSKKPEDRFGGDAELAIEALSAIVGRSLTTQTFQTRESFLRSAAMVGREGELALLRERLDRICAGRPGGLVLVLGEQGVGKSRLLAEARTRALVRGVVVLRGQAVGEGGAPFQLLREPLRWLCLLTEPSAEEAGVLKGLVPDIDTLLGRVVAPAPVLDSGGTLERLVQTIDALFGRLDRPALVLLEDLHWAGAEELQVIRRLGARGQSQNMLVVGSLRDDEVPSLPAQLPGAEVLRLGRLPRGAVARLARFMLGSMGRVPEVVDLLMRETEGNPLFVVEGARALLEEGPITGALPDRLVSGGVRAAALRRLERVDPRDKVLLRLAAVIGRELDMAVMGELSEPAELEGWITRVANAAVLEPNEGGWRFSHELIRELILDGLGANELGVLHRLVAQAMEGLDPRARASALARHWALAGEQVHELPWRVYAGQQALASGAHEEARRQLSRALELAPGQGMETSALARLMSDLAESCVLVGDNVGASRNEAAVLALFGTRIPSSPPGRLIRIALEALRQAWRLMFPAQVEPDASRRAVGVEASQVAGRVADVAMRTGDWITGVLMSLVAVNLSDRAGVAVPRALSVAGVILQSTGLRRLGARYLERARIGARQDPRALVDVLFFSAFDAVGQGRLDEAGLLLDEAYEIAARNAYRYGVVSVGGSRQICCRWSRARVGDIHWLAQESFALLRAGDETAAYALPAVALVLHEEGRGDEARAALQDLLPLITVRNTMARTITQAVLALLFAWAGRSVEANALARLALEGIRKLGPLPAVCQIGYSSLSEALLNLWWRDDASVDRAGVARDAREAVRQFKSWVRIYPVGRPELERHLGLTALLEGDEAGARRHLERALELARASGQTRHEALAALALGRLRSSDLAERRARLAHARGLLEGSGMMWTLRQVDEVETGLDGVALAPRLGA